jgi:prophage regulatory protein
MEKHHGILRGLYFGFARDPEPKRNLCMAQRLIPYEALKTKCIPYSKPHLWRLEKASKFPKRVPIGAGRYAYVEAEVDAWIDARIAERDDGAAA